MHYFNLSHPTLTSPNDAFGRGFQVMQMIFLEGAIWDGLREVLVIILPLYRTFYQLQVSQRPLCPFFAIIRNHKSNHFLSKTNMSVQFISVFK